MERGEITQSHLLFCSMIHVATDDSYSLSISISLSFSLFPNKYTHADTWQGDASQSSPALGSRRASLSETAALYSYQGQTLGYRSLLEASLTPAGTVINHAAPV